MKTQEAIKLGRELMHSYGLSDWTLTLDFAKRRFGQCRYHRKEISLSLPLIELNDETKVRDTILHEIAHALVGPNKGHTKVWKIKAIEVGATPERCYGEDVIQLPKKYTGTCPTCKREIKRDKRNRIACGKCCNGKYDATHRFVWIRN